MTTLIYPLNEAIVDTYTDIQNEFIDLIRRDGITAALDWLLPKKDGTELSFPEPIRFSWEGAEDGGYTFEISENEDFSSSYREKTADPFFVMTNLKIGQRYYWRVNGEDYRTFVTRDNRYRFLEVDGALNVRDIGGINIKQGMIFRGSDIENKYEITDIGRSVLRDILKIKTELNVRKDGAPAKEKSSIGDSVAYKCLPYRPYNEAFEDEHRRGIVRIMEFLADEDNYPIYIHCLGGADRTGMVALFLRALLGESDDDILTDYELTSLSSYAYGLTEGVDSLGYRSRESDYLRNFLTSFNEYKGETLGEKTESFLLECGVGRETIEKIRKILKA